MNDNQHNLLKELRRYPWSPNKAKVKAWVNALRSGAFLQGTGGLCSRPLDQPRWQFCCLGVWAETNMTMTGATWNKRQGKSSQTLSLDGWASTSYLPSSEMDDDVMEELAYANDTRGMTFEEIAEVAEQLWLTPHGAEKDI